jgi:hypothetical protein
VGGKARKRQGKGRLGRKEEGKRSLDGAAICQVMVNNVDRVDPVTFSSIAVL